MGAPQSPTYKLIAPDLAAQGESFTGIVVQETSSGYAPLGEGDQVVFHGQVVPVQQGGKITFPAIVDRVGNTFITPQVIRSGSTAALAARSHHIEVVPVKPDARTNIAHVPPVVSSGGRIRVTGQGLGALQSGSLIATDGSRIELGRGIGSSLQQIFFVPNELQKDTYRFQARDAAGMTYEAPNKTQNPTIKLSGSPITYRGQRGQITVSADADGTAILSGGEPQITLDQHTVDVRRNIPVQVGFTAQQLGEYQVHVVLVPPKDVPVSSDSPRVNADVEPIQASYNASRNETSVTAPVRLLNESGNSVANVPLDVALSHPGGVEYARVVTDAQGRAMFSKTLAGQIVTTTLSPHVYRVLGHAWKQEEPIPVEAKPVFEFTCCEKNLDASNLHETDSTTTVDSKAGTTTIEVKFKVDISWECDRGEGACRAFYDVTIAGSRWLELKKREWQPVVHDAKTFKEAIVPDPPLERKCGSGKNTGTWGFTYKAVINSTNRLLNDNLQFTFDLPKEKGSTPPPFDWYLPPDHSCCERDTELTNVNALAQKLSSKDRDEITKDIPKKERTHGLTVVKIDLNFDLKWFCAVPEGEEELCLGSYGIRLASSNWKAKTGIRGGGIPLEPGWEVLEKTDLIEELIIGRPFIEKCGTKERKRVWTVTYVAVIKTRVGLKARLEFQLFGKAKYKDKYKVQDYTTAVNIEEEFAGTKLPTFKPPKLRKKGQ